MSHYQWCICDMDGTLLNSQLIISKENEDALKKLQESGVEVIIASGRVDLMVKYYIKQLNLKGHVISCNGALIRNISTGEIVYSNPMNQDSVQKVISYCINKNLDYLIYTADSVYSNQENRKARVYESFNKTVSDELKVPIHYIEKIEIEREKFLQLDILKVLIICDNHSEVERVQDDFHTDENLTVVSSSNELLDIMASKISKGKAIKLLAERLHVNLDSVIAFGDNYNDLEMLEYVGMPIAMENSVEEVKKKAKYITKSNDESGVAYAIENLL